MLQLPETATVQRCAVIESAPAEILPSDVLSLVALHREADAAVDAARTDAEMSPHCDRLHRIYRALIAATPATLRDEAERLSYIIGYCKKMGMDGQLDGGWLDVPELEQIANNLLKLAEPPHPTKRLPNGTKGKKLTRAGLLYRYHAFLINELKTVGLELYGNDTFACYFTPFEDAVQSKLRRSGKDVFHDPRELATRARAVLNSLKIDAENAHDRTA